MELKDFIKETITQISEAVIELNGGKADAPLIVNPPYEHTRNYMQIVKADKHELRVTEINFNLVISESKVKGDGVKVGISVLGYNHDGNKKEGNETTISFPIYVSLPSTLRNGNEDKSK